MSRTILDRDKEPDREVAQKAKTLSQVVETTGRIVVFTLAALTLLSLAGQDITPLLASAGIAGVAIGFGAQNVIKDWLGGFFILFENQYSVDDVIKVGSYSGLVEKMDLRRTVLRAADGSVVVIPNGEIRVVTNLDQGVVEGGDGRECGLRGGHRPRYGGPRSGRRGARPRRMSSLS